jgi:hypothetical protein
MSDAKAGRAELDRLLAGHSVRTRQLAARVASQVEKNVAAGQHASQAVTDAMDAVGMAKGVRDTVGTAVVQSLCVGAGIWPSVKALPVEDHASLRKTALSGLWDGSGMTLSQTLHGTTKAMHDDVVKAIQGHIDNKATAWDSQRKIYDGYGFGGTIRQPKLSELPKDLQKLVDQASKVLTPKDLSQLQADAKRLSAYADRLATGPLKAAYGQMARRLEKGLTDGLDNLVRTATEEKARYHANRILRTEAARAWGQGFHKECMDDPDVVGWKWSTSSAHKVFDICDFHARADLYRMGPGIYPKDRHPSYPAHPHCFCNASQVYKGEVPDPVEQIDAGGKAALQGMTEDQRKRLLTLQGGKAFGQGGKWQGDLRQWTPPGGVGVSSGAQAVLKEVEGMGVSKWQPDFKFPKGFAEGTSKPAAVEAVTRFTPNGLLKPGHSLTADELDAAWSVANKATRGMYDRELARHMALDKDFPTNLDDREVSLIYGYTGPGYRLLNQVLRDGNADEEIAGVQSIINSGLSKLPQRSGTLYRGMKRNNESQAMLDQLQEGKIEEWNAFSSASTSSKVGEGFGSIFWVISDAKGADLTGLTQVPTEHEVLLPSMTKVLVEKIEQTPRGGVIIKARQVK